MFKGIGFALSACFVWGLIFIVPQFMEGFSSIEIAAGRYFFYGLVSGLLFLKTFLQGRGRYPWAIWKRAFLYSLIFAVGYYPCVVLGLRYATPAICALIMGIGPITLAFYGNWREKECSYRSLLVPSLFILIGLVAINVPALQAEEAPSKYLIGLAACFCALASFTWYVVANAGFLKQNRDMCSSAWATLNGVTTLIWVVLFALGMLLFSGQTLHLEKFSTLSPHLTSFLIGSAVLGVICSWIGIFLWNKATLYLPVSFAGQLTIFETIFGIVFIYLLEQQLPPIMECLGIASFILAVTYGIKKSSPSAPHAG